MKSGLFLLVFSLLLTTGVCSAGIAAQAKQEQKISAYQERIGFYRYYKPDSAALLARQAYAEFEKSGDLSGMAAMLKQMGMVDDNLGMPDEARGKYDRALSLYRRLQDKKGEASILIRIGVVEMRAGNYVKAISRFVAALRISEKLSDYQGMVEAHNTIGEVYLARKNYNLALAEFKLAERAAARAPMSGNILNMYANFGVAYTGMDSTAQAERYLQKGLALSSGKKYAGLQITILNIMASVHAKMGNRQKAVGVLLQALDKSRAIKNYLRELQTLRSLADNHKDDLNAQRRYLMLALHLAQAKGASRQQIEISAALSSIYKELGEYETALGLTERAYALADSLYYRSAGQRIASITAAYEKEKADAELRELRLLNSKKSFQQTVTLAAAGAILTLFLILAVSFFRVRSLNRKLTASNTVKDKLFSVLGHDLRAPFASIVNLLYLINDETLTAAERRELIQKLSIKCNGSLETLNNLLRWGEMQIKGLRVNPKHFNAAPIIARNLDLVSDRAEDKNICVENATGASANSLWVFADPDHFEFVIRNLLSNALKFTQPGGKVSLSSETTGTGQISFAVKDTGVGIPENRISNLFNPANVSQKGTAAEIGTGLGLLLCQEFTGLNRGRLEVTSEIGKGSIFTITLPAGQVPAPVVKPA